MLKVVTILFNVLTLFVEGADRLRRRYFFWPCAKVQRNLHRTFP